MTQHEFDMLSNKYLAGHCSSEEEALLKKWSDEHFNHYEKNNIFQEAGEELETEKRIWARVSSDAFVTEETPETRLAKTFGSNKWLLSGIAACVVAGLFFLLNRNEDQPQSRQVTVHGIETKNIAHSEHKVTLPDGSIVILHENASIITEENYGVVNRTVHLTGEAFFDIVPNPKVPFLVHSGDLVTEVLGTSFRIKPQNEDATIEVSVKTGRVSVYSTDVENGKKRNGVIITPNQKILYDTKNKNIRPDIVDSPEFIKPPVAANFRFEESSVLKVLTELQNAYGVEMEVANPVLNQCAFTGDLNGLTMYKQLEMICGVINAEYEIRGTTIFIKGKGCLD